MKVDVVVASYREALDWFWLLPKTWQLFLYNTDDTRDGFDLSQGPQESHVRKLPNGGREAGQWLGHLEHQYPDFADVTLFLQGRPFDHEAHTLLQLLHEPQFPANVCYVGGRAPVKGMMSIAPSGPAERALRIGWGDEPIPSPIWFACGAQFYVKRELILARPRDHYTRIRQGAYDPSYGSFGHLMEPLWGSIFDWEKFA